MKEISSGNAFWCKTIANFILEHGDEEFTHTIKMKTNISNSLQYLVLCLLEKLSPEQQIVAKYASIIGYEFTEIVLSSVLPAKLAGTVKTILEGMKKEKKSFSFSHLFHFFIEYEDCLV